MSSLKYLIGRKYLFLSTPSGIYPVRELPSSTWFHADGTVSPANVEMPPESRRIEYSEADIALCSLLAERSQARKES